MLVLDTAGQQSWRDSEKRESAQEKRQRLLAENLQKLTVTVEPDAGRDVSDLMAQMGKPLSCQQVIDKLRKCNSRLYFQVSTSDPSKVGVYIHDPSAKLYINPLGEAMHIKHLFGMESGVMPEFSVLHKTKTKVANQELFGKTTATRGVDWSEVETFASETRGWRTVLVRLLHLKLITEGDVQKHFGWTPSHQSKKWKDQVS